MSGMCRGRGTAWVAALPGASPDALYVVDVVTFGVVGLDRRLYVVVGTAAEQLLPLLNGNDLRRGFHICSLHNCYLLFVV